MHVHHLLVILVALDRPPRYGPALHRPGRPSGPDHDPGLPGPAILRPGTATAVRLQPRRGHPLLQPCRAAGLELRHVLLGRGLRVRPTRERGDGLRHWSRGIPGPPAGPRTRARREPPGAGLHRPPREAGCADPTRPS